MCIHCGAPLDVGVDGGRVVCEYCQTPNLVRRRDDGRDRAQAARSAASKLSESERLEKLRWQDRKPMAVPDRIRGWMVGHALDPRHRGDALREWVAMRRTVVEGSTAHGSESLFALTTLLAPLLDAHHERALLENAVDVLDDRVHRNVLRCRLAHHAAVGGDQKAAEAWLAPVDPRPLSLRADTAYRLAVGYVALTRGVPQGVFQQLGRDAEDVPIFDGYDDEASLLRCHAYEVSGQPQEATRRLSARLRDPRSFAAFLRVARQAGMALCPATLPRAEAAQWKQFEAELLPPRNHLVQVVGLLFGAALLGGGGYLVWLGVLALGDASVLDPLTPPEHPLILGGTLSVLGTGLFLASAGKMLVAGSLHRNGYMTLGRVISAERILERSASEVVVEVKTDARLERITTWSQNHLPLDEYPVYFDPNRRQVLLDYPSPLGALGNVGRVGVDARSGGRRL